jgi:cysteinyl-tRNA synthetase
VPAPIRRQGGVDPLALRYTLMQGQYRKPFNFTLDTLRTAARHVRRFQEAAERVDAAIEADVDGPDPLGPELGDLYERTLAAMCDDLNTPAATAAALEGVQAIEDMDTLSGAAAHSARFWLDQINDLLGIVEPEHDRESPPSDAEDHAVQTDHFDASVDELLEQREAARADGEYARADAIRDTLEALGVEVMDRPDGPEWRRKDEL